MSGSRKRYDRCPQLSFAALHCLCDASTIRSVISAWLDAYPDDFRSPPHYTALRRLRQFAVDEMRDSELERRVVDRLSSVRRQEAVHRRPRSAGAQRQRASHMPSLSLLYTFYCTAPLSYLPFIIIIVIIIINIFNVA